jgi:hypothetical protein
MGAQSYGKWRADAESDREHAEAARHAAELVRKAAEGARATEEDAHRVAEKQNLRLSKLWPSRTWPPRAPGASSCL